MADINERDKPTYYVSLSDYNETKKMFLAANNEIIKLKNLLNECKRVIGSIPLIRNIYENDKELRDRYLGYQQMCDKINEVLK